MKLNITISLESDAMQSEDAIKELIKQTADKIVREDGFKKSIIDYNGNKIGTMEVY